MEEEEDERRHLPPRTRLGPRLLDAREECGPPSHHTRRGCNPCHRLLFPGGAATHLILSPAMTAWFLPPHHCRPLGRRSLQPHLGHRRTSSRAHAPLPTAAFVVGGGRRRISGLGETARTAPSPRLRGAKATLPRSRPRATACGSSSVRGWTLLLLHSLCEHIETD